MIYDEIETDFFKEFEKNISSRPDLTNRLKKKSVSKQIIIKDELLSFSAEYVRKITREIFKNPKKYHIPQVIEKLSEISSHCNHLRPKLMKNASNDKFSIVLDGKTKRQLSLKKSGSYYTPNMFAEYLSEHSIQFISNQKFKRFRKVLQKVLKKGSFHGYIEDMIEQVAIRVIDPACGNGNFLRASLNPIEEHINRCIKTLNKVTSKNQKLEISKNLFNRLPVKINEKSQIIRDSIKIGEFIAKNCLFGHDIKKNAIVICESLLGLEMLQKFTNTHEIVKKLNIKNLDSIISYFSTISSTTNQQYNPPNDLLIWDREYKEVYKHGGFDVVLGNPPWEIIKPNDREFFRNFDENFQKYPRKQQDKRKKELLDRNPEVESSYNAYNAKIGEKMNFIEKSGMYRLQSALIDGRKYSGDLQYYKLFLEVAYKIIKKRGIVALIVQQNFLGSKGCAELRKHYLTHGDFLGLWEFYNKTDEWVFFKDVDLKQRFVLFIFQKKGKNTFPIHFKRCQNIKDLNFDFKEFQCIPFKEISHFFPEEFQIFTFKNDDEKAAFLKLSEFQTVKAPIMWRNREYEIRLSQDLHVTRDRNEITNRKIGKNDLAVWSGRNIGVFYYVDEPTKYYHNKEQNPITHTADLACRNILPNSAKRFLFTKIPTNVMLTNACTRLKIMETTSSSHESESHDNIENLQLLVLAVCNSLTVEFYLKTFLTGINLNYYLIEKIPIPDLNQKMSNSMDLVEKIIRNSKFLVDSDVINDRWGQKYMENETMIASLFNLNQNEFETILNGFDFQKLRRTRFSGKKPFQNIEKDVLLNFFRTMV